MIFPCKNMWRPILTVHNFQIIPLNWNSRTPLSHNLPHRTTIGRMWTSHFVKFFSWKWSQFLGKFRMNEAGFQDLTNLAQRFTNKFRNSSKEWIHFELQKFSNQPLPRKTSTSQDFYFLQISFQKMALDKKTPRNYPNASERDKFFSGTID